MQFFIYFLVSAISFLGLAFGIIIAFIAKDELKQGKKYFITLQNAIMALSVGVLAYFYKIDLYFVVILTLLIFFVLFYIENVKKSYVIYPLLAFIFYISSGITSFFVVESVLIFLYGFPTAALLVRKRKDIIYVILKHIPFLIIVNFLPLVFP